MKFFEWYPSKGSFLDILWNAEVQQVNAMARRIHNLLSIVEGSDGKSFDGIEIYTHEGDCLITVQKL